MFRRRVFALAVVLLAVASGASADDKPSPFYALPADGTWLEYEWTRTTPERKTERGTLRLSSVGVKDADDVRCRWLEIKVETGQGERAQWQCRKLLVAEKAFTSGKPLEDCVLDCFHQEAGQDVVRLPKNRTDAFLRLNLSGDDLTLREIKAQEEVTTGLGKLTARHVAASGKNGANLQEYHAWLANDAPFGVVKFEIHERNGTDSPRVVFTAVAKRAGKEARSEVDHSGVK
jgi:hypothetical protein